MLLQPGILFRDVCSLPQTHTLHSLVSCAQFQNPLESHKVKARECDCINHPQPSRTHSCPCSPVFITSPVQSLLLLFTNLGI